MHRFSAVVLYLAVALSSAALATVQPAHIAEADAVRLLGLDVFDAGSTDNPPARAATATSPAPAEAAVPRR